MGFLLIGSASLLIAADRSKLAYVCLFLHVAYVGFFNAISFCQVFFRGSFHFVRSSTSNLWYTILIWLELESYDALKHFKHFK